MLLRDIHFDIFSWLSCQEPAWICNSGNRDDKSVTVLIFEQNSVSTGTWLTLYQDFVTYFLLIENVSAWPNEPKLGRNPIWKVLYKKCSLWPDSLINIASIGNSCYTPAPPEGGYTVLPPSVCPSVQDIFRCIFLSNYWWQKSDIWSQASYRYAILWEVFLDPSDSYFLFADLGGFYMFFIHIERIC